MMVTYLLNEYRKKLAPALLLYAILYIFLITICGAVVPNFTKVHNIHKFDPQ